MFVSISSELWRNSTNWNEQIFPERKKKKNSFQRTWTTCLIPTLLICVLSQRIEANLCNKSHPSLCYCNTNYIIGSSSWRHAWHCRKMCARNPPPPTSQLRIGSVFCQVEGGVWRRAVFALVRCPGGILCSDWCHFTPEGWRCVLRSNRIS